MRGRGEMLIAGYFFFYELKSQYQSIKDLTDRTFVLRGSISDPGSLIFTSGFAYGRI